MVVFSGGARFAIAANMLGYLFNVGDFATPAEALVPEEDADTFEQLLKDENIKYHRHLMREKV